MADEREQSSETLRILMLPWLAHGHTSPFLELGKRLSCRGFHVYLCSTEANLASFRNEDNGGVDLMDLLLPELPELPAHLHTTKNLPPHLMPQLKAAFDLSEPYFCSVLDSLRPSLVLYDFLQPWAAAAAAAQKISAVLFLPVGCASYAFVSHLAAKPDEEFPFQSMRFEDDEEVDRLRRLIVSVSDRPANGDKVAESVKLSSNFVLIRTSAEIEGEFADYASRLAAKELVPVGTLVGNPRQQHETDPRWSRLFAWLDKRPSSSLAFVSFGSEFFMGKEEMAEVARGLELSGVGFIWVVRFPQGGEVSLEEALPEGFLERSSDKGMVVEGWAPQDQILAHAAVGAFVSHCGWGSVMEALRRGMPLVAMPQQLDQPLNAMFVTGLGVGVNVRRRRFAGQEDKRYDGEELARALKAAVFGKESEELKKRSRHVAEVLHRKGDAEVDVAAAKLAQLIHSAGRLTPGTPRVCLSATRVGNGNRHG